MLTCTSNTLSKNLSVHVQVYLGLDHSSTIASLSHISISQKLNHLRRNATLLEMTIESVCIHIVKASQRPKALVELPNSNIHICTYLSYNVYNGLGHKDDYHKRSHHHLQSQYHVLQSLACNTGTYLSPMHNYRGGQK